MITRLVSQQDRIEALFHLESFSLVVLDSCRFDAFARHATEGTLTGHERAVSGFLREARAIGTHSYPWLQRALTAWCHDVVVFSEHPIINSEGRTPSAFLPTVNQHSYESDATWHATDHFPAHNIHDFWQDDADGLADAVAASDADKKLVWLMDTHHPYSGNGDTPEDRYHDSIPRAIDRVAAMVADLPDPVFITGDHGESFQPPSAFGLDIDWKEHLRHEPGIRSRDVSVVPWFAVSTDD